MTSSMIPMPEPERNSDDTTALTADAKHEYYERIVSAITKIHYGLESHNVPGPIQERIRAGVQIGIGYSAPDTLVQSKARNEAWTAALAQQDRVNSATIEAALDKWQAAIQLVVPREVIDPAWHHVALVDNTIGVFICPEHWSTHCALFDGGGANIRRIQPDRLSTGATCQYCNTEVR